MTALMVEQEMYCEEDAGLAGEYVLGLLDDDEREAFEARLANEPHLRELVNEWEGGYVPYGHGIEEVRAPTEFRNTTAVQIVGGTMRSELFEPFPVFRFIMGALTALILVSIGMMALPPP